MNNFFKTKFLSSLILVLVSGVFFISVPTPTSAQTGCGISVNVNGNDVDISWDFQTGLIWGVDWQIFLDGNMISSGASSSGSWSENLPDGNYNASAQYSEGGMIYDDTGGERFGDGCTTSVDFTVDTGGGGGGNPPLPTGCTAVFSADDIAPAYGTDTTLRVTLDDHYSWTITLDQGSVVPSPSSGTLNTGASNTGNLTETHTYHLRCNNELTSQANKWVTVTPGPPTAPGDYDGAQFISQTINGVVNPASIALNAGQTYSASIVMNNNGTTTWNQPSLYALGSWSVENNGVWAPTARVVIPSGQTVGAGATKTFTFNITPPLNPPLGTCAGTTLPTTCNFHFRMVHDGANGPIIPAWFGDYTPNVSVTVNPPVPTGSISATTCTIAQGASNCNALLTWSTANLTGNPTQVTRTNPGGTHVSWATSGTNVANAVAPGNYTYYLYHNSVELDNSGQITVACVGGTTWNGSICALTPGVGSCGAAVNTCGANNTIIHVPDSPTHYLWDCQGPNGGSIANCSIPKAGAPTLAPDKTTTTPGECTTLRGACPAGTVSATLDGISISAPFTTITQQICDKVTTIHTLSCVPASGPPSTGAVTVTVKKTPYFQED